MRSLRTFIRIVFAFLLLALVAACHRPLKVVEPAETPSPELLTVDSVLWQQPDTALACLVSCFDACTTTEYNRHYANLLLSELLYKNDYAQTNHPELQQSVAYFDSLVGETPPLQRGSEEFPPLKGGKGDSKHKPISNNDHFFLAARAHYINGVGYYENDSAVPACREYLKALEIMEECFEEKELVGDRAKFLALAYTRLTVLYSNHYLHDPAIYFGKKSLQFYRKSNSPTWHLAWMMDEIGSHYDMLGTIDSAAYYYYGGLNLLTKSDNLTYRDITTHLAYLSYKKGESSESSLNLLHRLIDMAESDKEYYSRCLTIGEVFYHETQFDSAWPYYNTVFNNTQSEESKKLAAERLVEISKVIGYDSKSTEYASYLTQFATISEKRGALNSVLVELYRQYGQSKEAQLHTQSIRKNTKRAVKIISSLIVLTGLSIIINIIIRKHNKRLRMEKQKTEELLETESYSHKIKQAALSSRLKKSNEALRDTLKQLENNSTAKEPPRHAKDYHSFMETPICRHILETVHNQGFKSKMDCVVYKEHALQKEQLLALRVAADEKMDDFTARIKKHFPCLTDDDVTYCCFYLLGLNEADISALMQKAYPTVCERKRKIRRIIGEGKDLPFVLRNLP